MSRPRAAVYRVQPGWYTTTESVRDPWGRLYAIRRESNPTGPGGGTVTSWVVWDSRHNEVSNHDTLLAAREWLASHAFAAGPR